ncbi:paramyosin-like [Papaver somniferum]|uniref:paramyosin-like n=1 Tax=Papaver somniferum TaxID=3469 RepID=UPI000E6F7F73|nr:paramyosin-like [Papaver somniferum]
MARKDEAKIKALSEDLQKEKDHSRKQGQKIEKLLTRCMQRQMSADEASSSLEDIRAEMVNLTTQNDFYVSKNSILNEKAESLCLQVDRLSVECSRNEELNLHLHNDNLRLKLELQRVSNSLTTSRSLHSSSIANYKKLEEDYDRVIKSKIEIASTLRRSRNTVDGLNEEVDCLKKKVKLLQDKLATSSRAKPAKSSPPIKPASLRGKGALAIQSDKSTLKSPHGEVSLIFAESYERHKSQVLRITRERDEGRGDVSHLNEEIESLNDNMDEIIDSSKKVAKTARKNTQSYLVPLFNDYCAEHGIPPPSFPLEIFSDDEKPQDEADDPTNEELSLDDDEEPKVDTSKDNEGSKGASTSITEEGGEIPESTIIDSAIPQ